MLNDQGCLVKDCDGNYYIGVVELLEKIAEKNWDVVLVSGRNKIQLRCNAQLLGLKNYISELGSELVYNLGEKIYVTFDNRKYHYEITKNGKDLVNIIKIFKEKFPGRIDSRLEWSKDRTYNALFFGEVDIDEANKVLMEAGYKGLVLLDNGFSKLVELNLDVKNLHIYNILPEGVDKLTAIRLDKKIRNLSTKNCIALGDSAEDLKMAKEVQFFFLMKDVIECDDNILNKLAEFKNVYVTDNSMNRGWTEVINYLVS